MLFEGLDTETINGYARIVATSKEWIEVNTFDDILNFLQKDCYQDNIFMLWNLKYDV